MSLTKEDVTQIREMIIDVLKSCENIGHNWEYKNRPGGTPYAKKCTRCGDYVCDYEVNF